MNIEDLTIRQARELARLCSSGAEKATLDVAVEMIGQYVLVRTYSAGVWAGTLSNKRGNEVILNDARRLWLWKAKKGISLSAIAVNGVDESESRIAGPVPVVWLEAIEIIPFAGSAGMTVEKAKNAEAR